MKTFLIFFDNDISFSHFVASFYRFNQYWNAKNIYVKTVNYKQLFYITYLKIFN